VRLDFGLELRSIGKRIAVQLFTNRIEDFPRGPDAQISGNQRRFKLLEQRWIDLLFTQENRIGSFGQCRLGLADRSLQLLRQRRFRFAKKRNHVIACSNPAR